MKRILNGAVFAALVFCACARPALAQIGLIDLVPAAEFTDERSVDLAGAVYRHHETLLSIGGGGGTRSLDLVLNLTSPDSSSVTISCPEGSTAMGIYLGLNSNAYFGVTRSYTSEQTAVLPHQSAKFSVGPSGIITSVNDRYATGTYDPNLGQVNYVGEDGTEAVFSNLHSNGYAMTVEQIRFPDGETWTYRYNDITSSTCGPVSRLRSIVSSRGYALQFDYAADPTGHVISQYTVHEFRRLVRVTAYNKASVHCNEALLQSCASVAALGSAVTFALGTSQATITKPNGETVVLGFFYDHLISITRPTGTRTMTYAEWSEQEGPTYRHLSSVTEAGRTWTYGYWPIDSYNVEITLTEPSGAASTYYAGGTYVYRAVDPLMRENLYGFSGYARLTSRQYPEGNQVTAGYDSRGNLNLVRHIPRPGSGLPTLEATAVYPSSCTATDHRTCNQPTSTTDFNTNTTDYTYDPAHGGVLTETGPAVNGIRPQTRHGYAQHYAWISNGSGGFAQAATPVWVRTATSSCRTSAATGNPASPCGTAGDEVLIQYDYGPNSGPNNLLLRGQTVTATDNSVTTTLRTCYSYDAAGNRISETSPNANLASCS